MVNVPLLCGILESICYLVKKGMGPSVILFNSPWQVSLDSDLQLPTDMHRASRLLHHFFKIFVLLPAFFYVYNCNIN